MNFPSCNASKCRILRHFAIHALKSVMYRILSKSGLEGKMRQISASKRSRNSENRLLRFWAGIILHSTTSVNLSPQRKTQDIIASLQIVSLFHHVLQLKKLPVNLRTHAIQLCVHYSKASASGT